MEWIHKCASKQCWWYSYYYYYLKAGGKDCIGVQLQNKNGAVPAHIVFTTNDTNKNSGVCKQVVESAPVKAYLDSTVTGVNSKKAMAIGSSTSVYTTPTQ